jgi:CheY-like chemotaxis protein
LNNAVKFTLEKGMIELKATKQKNDESGCLIRFEVTDTGIGIAPEELKRLWEVLEQADNSITRKYGGLGLGLSLTKRILEMMGSHITVESELGEGSRFICEILFGLVKSGLANAELGPAKSRAADTGLAGSRTVESGDDPTDVLLSLNLAGKRALVVDDLELNRAILFAMLEDSGAVLDGAKDGDEAVEMFMRTQYDLVLMDIHMPVMDGYTATKPIRSSAQPWAKTVPVISITADTGAEIHSKCLEAGITDCIEKPVEVDVLYKTIKKWLPGA